MPSTRTVLLVVAHSRSDRWPTTELYKRHFLGVLHMVSGKGCGKATAGVLCMHVASSPHYLYHDNVAKILAALARARAVSRGAHDMSKSRAAASSGQAGAPPPRPPLPSWASALREAVGDARMRLASGVLVGHMDFWLRPPSFGRGLRREMPWRLPRGLMPKHEPTSIRLLRSLNVSGDGGAPRTLERGAVVRYRTARGLAFHRYGPKASIPILSISNATEVELAGGGTLVGETLAPPGALPPALGARHSQRHHADFVLHDYFFGGCFGAERLRAEHSWFWGFGAKTTGSAAAANLSAVLPALDATPHSAARVHATGTVCAGWSDLYHVPLRLAAEFQSLARHYRYHNVWHEVAVSTILHILSNGSSAALEDVISGCFGCCCCSTAPAVHPAALIQQYHCGHRLNLADERARDALRDALLAPAPAGAAAEAHHQKEAVR